MDPNTAFLIACICLMGCAILAGLGLGKTASGPQVDLRQKLKNLSANQELISQEVDLGLEEQAKKPKVDYRAFFSRFTGQVYLENLDKELVQCDIPLKVGEFLMVRLALVIGTFLGVQFYFGNILYSVAAAGVMVFIHIPVMAIKRGMRISSFVEQLAEFLTLITNSLRAGQTFLQGVDIASRESPNPIGMEFRLLLKETNLGVPVEEAFDNMLQRVPSEDLKIVMSAFSIQRQVGGNLADIMDQVSGMIRQRIQIQGQIKVLTTQGKLSGAIVGLLPFGLGTIISMINYEYMSKLWTVTPEAGWAGPAMLGVGIFMQLLGCFVIYKICDIEV